MFGSRQLIWRISDKRLAEWKKARYSATMTYRKAAQWCGRILRHHYVSLKPLFEVEDVIQLIRQFGRYAGGDRKRWNDTVTISAESMEFLQVHWKTVLLNQWQSTKVDDSLPSVVIFTDASGNDGWGFVIATLEGAILMEKWCPWRPQEIGMHIFIKETWATLWAMKCARRKFGNLRKMILGLDNMPSLHAIVRGYSTNCIANAAIKAIYGLLCEATSASFRRIPGKKNPANEPSHRMKADPQKVVEGVRILLCPAGSERDTAPPCPNTMGLRQNIDEVKEAEADDEGAINLIEALLQSFEDETQLYPEVKQTCT